VGAVLAEETYEWEEGCRSLGLEVLGRCRLSPVTTDLTEVSADFLTISA